MGGILTDRDRLINMTAERDQLQAQLKMERDALMKAFTTLQAQLNEERLETTRIRDKLEIEDNARQHFKKERDALREALDEERRIGDWMYENKGKKTYGPFIEWFDDLEWPWVDIDGNNWRAAVRSVWDES